MGVIYARNANGAVTGFTELADIGQAQAAGMTLLRPDLSPFHITPFMGGTLLDYLPINIFLEGRWYKGQKEALTPYWNSGQFPRPDASVLALTVVDIPAAVTAVTGTGDSGMPPWVWLVGGYMAYRMLR